MDHFQVIYVIMFFIFFCVRTHSSPIHSSELSIGGLQDFDSNVYSGSFPHFDDPLMNSQMIATIFSYLFLARWRTTLLLPATESAICRDAARWPVVIVYRCFNMVPSTLKTEISVVKKGIVFQLEQFLRLK